MLLLSAAGRLTQTQATHACCQAKANASRVSLLSTPLCTHARTFLALTGTADDATASRVGIQTTPKALETARCRVRSFPSQSCKDPTRMPVLPRQSQPAALPVRGAQLTSTLGGFASEESPKRGAVHASRELPRDLERTPGLGTLCLQSDVFRPRCCTTGALSFPQTNQSNSV